MSTQVTTVKKEINKKATAYYMEDVNINWSFKTLTKKATDLGVKFENGDVLVVDNVNKNKRKMLKVTKVGAIIVYAMLNKTQFQKLFAVSEADSALELFGE